VASRKLIVFAHLDVNWAPCGLLTLTETPELVASSFIYGTRYLERKNAIEVDPLGLSIEHRKDVKGKELFPTGGLPFFGGIRDAAPDAWGRRVIESKLKVPANSLPESEYLLHAGSERIGALDVRVHRDDAPYPSVTGMHSLQHLIEAADRIDAGEPVPAHLEVIFQDGTALGGARPKATIRDDDGVLWLAKFDTKKDAFCVPAIEAATLQLAKECGMTVPEVRTVNIGERKVMLIRRFDRYFAAPGMEHTPANLWQTHPGNGTVEKRLPFVSGLTLVDCDERQSPTKAYADLADAIGEHCHPKMIMRDMTELFARMVYNIFVSNDDDHLRNHGFICDPNLGDWRLSPLYDVLPRPGISHERHLHLGVGVNGRLATLDNALSSCGRFGLTTEAALKIIAQVWEKVREWRVYFEGYGVEEPDITKVTSAFRHLDEVSSEKLRKCL
jgi:serine/threonine-protein kinase HipA